MSNFDDASALAIVVRIRTKSLYMGSYSDSQQRLFDTVFAMREQDKLTFADIAKRLTEQGIQSAKGCLLAAEHVFSIYKKGKLRMQRMKETFEPELVSVGILLKAGRSSSGWFIQ